ncbi:transposable element Tcb2 transposase [Trichonephila clavipes]|nr:transposable element Tcb2 transposase [Trichonephila clavipes]
MQRDCALSIAGEAVFLKLRGSPLEGRAGFSGSARDVIYTKSGSGSPRQTSPRKDRRIVRNARVEPTASSNAIQAQVALSLENLVSYRTIRRRLGEGHLGSRQPLRVLPSTPPFGVVPRTRKLDYSGMEPGGF